MHPTRSDFPPDNVNSTLTSETLQTLDLTGEFSPELGEHSRAGVRTDSVREIIPKSQNSDRHNTGSYSKTFVKLQFVNTL